MRLARSFVSLVPKGASTRRPTPREREVPCVEHVVRGVVRLRVWPADTEHPEIAIAYDASGHMHGPEREWFPDGRLKYDARWIHGVQHGLQRQWDAHGRLVVRERFVRGTGLDAYCGHGRVITETREMKQGRRHGWERWWTDARHVHAEGHFHEGLEHGVFREWRRAKRPMRRYFVRGVEVERAAYLRAVRSDPTLPPLVPGDDDPRRQRPKLS